MQEFADSIAWWVILGAGVPTFWLVFELGFRHGRKRRDHAGEDEKSQVRTVLAALIGLLGLFLAFSFDMVAERFETRKTLVIKEANAISTAYLRAGMIPDPHRTRVRELLRKYVEERLGVHPENFEERLQQAVALQHALWTHAEAIGDQHSDSEIVALFVQSLNDVIDVHEERLASGVHHRLPITLLAALFLVSLLAIGSLGHSSGLTHYRSPLPILAIILAIIIVETLIIDLDRPLAGLFDVRQDVMSELKETVFVR
jgi:hypothetical protein